MKATNNILLSIVDDDKMYAYAIENNIQKALKDDNVSIKSFDTGEMYFENINNEYPQIVVLDYYLDSENKNSLNGIEVLKKIKSSNPNTQVVMLSAQDKLEIAVDCIKHGAQDYIVKSPSASVRLKKLIKNIVYDINLERKMKRYELWNWIFAGNLLLILLLDIIYLLSKT